MLCPRSSTQGTNEALNSLRIKLTIDVTLQSKVLVLDEGMS